MPTLTSTKFLAEGKLTIEEFISAGDNLVGKCPTWQWSGCEEGSRDQRFPPEKQFLITKRVPCPRRVLDIETSANNVQEVLLDDGWVETRLEGDENGDGEQVVDIDDAGIIQDVGGPGRAAATASKPDAEMNSEEDDSDSDGECLDMEADLAKMEEQKGQD